MLSTASAVFFKLTRAPRSDHVFKPLMIAHNPGLVLLSTTIAVLGAFTASITTSHMSRLRRSERLARFIMASFALGGALWAMQFVELLSLERPVNFQGSIALLVASAVIALSGAPASLFILGVSKERRRARKIYAVAILGLTIAATNFISIAIAGASLNCSWFLGASAFAFSMLAAVIAIWLLYRGTSILSSSAASLFVGLCLSLSSYLAVGSLTDSGQPLEIPLNSELGAYQWHLAWAAAVMVYLMCSICLLIFFIGQFDDGN